jgi:DNA-binding transcriptional ArsR family regulator
MNAKYDGKCYSPKPELKRRPLLSVNESSQLEAIFKVLGNATRLRMLHALVCESELCVSELADKVGMKPQAVSNQLTRLSDRGIVTSRRNGLEMVYRIVDPCTISILDYAWCLVECAQSGNTEQEELEAASV